MRIGPVSLLAITFGLGCGPAVSDGNGNATGDGGPSGPDARPGESEFTDAAPPEPCEKMDILFVIDDSGSMAQERDNLRSNFPAFVSAIDNFVNAAGSALDYRIAVTSTTVDHDYIDSRPPIGDFPATVDGPDGAFFQDCGMGKRWLERGEAGIADKFSCIADLSALAVRVEMPLEAMERAFEERVSDGTNDGFLRDDALLAVIVLTDEDDCSTEANGFTLENGSDRCTEPDWPHLKSTDDYAAFLDGVKSGRGRWAVAAIGGVCEDDTHDARPAVRLQSFVDAAGDNGVFSSICTGGDLTGPLNQALATFTEACDAIPPVL